MNNFIQDLICIGGGMLIALFNILIDAIHRQHTHEEDKKNKKVKPEDFIK